MGAATTDDPRALDVPADAELDAVVRIAAAVTGMSMAPLNVLDAHRQSQLATVGLPRRDTLRDESLCARALRTGGVFSSADLTGCPVRLRLP
jgi:hypothetical protein